MNDPDPLPWVSLYGAAAVACVLGWWRPGHWGFPALVAVASAAWAASLAPGVVGHVRFGEMFGAFEMESVAVEEAREMYGLLIVVFWMVVLIVRARRVAGHAASGEASPELG